MSAAQAANGVRVQMPLQNAPAMNAAAIAAAQTQVPGANTGRIPHSTAVETVAEMNRHLVASRPRTTELADLPEQERQAIAEQVRLMTPMFQRVDQLLPVFLAMTGNIDATKRLILMKYMFQDQLDVVDSNKFVFNLATLQKLKDQFQRYFQFVKNQISNPQNRARLQQEATAAAAAAVVSSGAMQGMSAMTTSAAPLLDSSAAALQALGPAISRLTPQQIATAQAQGASAAQIQALQQVWASQASAQANVTAFQSQALQASQALANATSGVDISTSMTPGVKRSLKADDLRLPLNKRRQSEATSPTSTTDPKRKGTNAEASPKLTAVPVTSTAPTTSSLAIPSLPTIVDPVASAAASAANAAAVAQVQRNQLRDTAPKAYFINVLEELCRDPKTQVDSALPERTDQLLADILDPIVSKYLGPRTEHVESIIEHSHEAEDWFQETLEKDAFENATAIEAEYDDQGNAVDSFGMDSAKFEAAMQAVAGLTTVPTTSVPAAALEDSFEEAPSLGMDAAAAMEIVV